MVSLRHILRYSAGVLIGLLVLEFCARLDDYISYKAPMWERYDPETIYIRDQIGITGKPGARYKKWQLNSLGFRGPELRPGGVRIVCIGASETFGLYEAPDEEYPRQLERELNDWAKQDIFQVVNVAYPGETIGTQILRLPEIVNAVRPQLALIYPSPAQYIWLPWLNLNSAGPDPAPRFEWRIASNLTELAKELLPEPIQNDLRERQIRNEAVRYQVMDEVPEANVVRFHDDLKQLIETAQENDVKPVLITHATHLGPVSFAMSPRERDILVSWRKFFPMLKEEGFLDMELRMDAAIRQVAAEQHVALVDAAREIPPGPRNFADFSHFTSAGAHIMAVRIADELEPLLGSRPGNEVSSRASLTSSGR